MKNEFTIEVGPERYTVRLTRNWPKCKGEEVEATVAPRTNTIRIYRGLGEDGIRRAFWHEVAHLLDYNRKEEAVEPLGDILSDWDVAINQFLGTEG